MVKIGIKSWGSISPLGFEKQSIKNAYQNQDTCFQFSTDTNTWIASLEKGASKKVEQWKAKDRLYQKCDDTVLFALEASAQALENSGWTLEKDTGVFIGSSRGAARLLEDNYQKFLNKQSIEVLTSPLTTMGNISAVVARNFGLSGFADTLSMTCSSGFHAFLQAMVWLQSGMKKRILAGGSEAPLTPFFVEQLQQLKLYSKNNGKYPNHSLKADIKSNTMILGEGAAVFALEAVQEEEDYEAVISGIGYGMEHNSNLVGLSKDGKNVQASMKMALQNQDPETIDAIVMHAPGTVQGDSAEKAAVKAVFGNYMPVLLSNKWKIGHCLGASGMLSLEMALLMLENQEIFETPFTSKSSDIPKKIMVNALGFGGSAITIIIEKV